jgi:hypothetical protein
MAERARRCAVVESCGTCEQLWEDMYLFNISITCINDFPKSRLPSDSMLTRFVHILGLPQYN